MAEKYVGSIVIEIDGQEIECVSLDKKVNTGRVPVKTMNRTGRVKGHAAGIKTIELSVEVAIPLEGEPDWEAVEDARITQSPVTGNGPRESYTGCAVLEVSGQYKVEGHAVRRLTISALDHVKE